MNKQREAGISATTKILDADKVSGKHLNLKEMLDMYQSRVRPTMLFGSEVTIGAKSDILQNVELFLLRRLLAIPDKSNVNAIYLELGLYPIETIRIEKAIQYYFYASDIDAPELELVRLALRDNMMIIRKPKSRTPSWFFTVQKLANSVGLQLYTEVPPEGIAVLDMILRFEVNGKFYTNNSRIKLKSKYVLIHIRK